MMEGLRIAAYSLSLVSLLVLIVALGSEYWGVDSERREHSGLWRACRNESCVPLGMQVAGYIHATRAFMLMAMVAGAVSFFGLCASFSRTHIGSMPINRLAALVSCGAGFCSLFAMSIFTGVNNDAILLLKKPQYGWSFGLGWASIPMFFITGALAYKAGSTAT